MVATAGEPEPVSPACDICAGRGWVIVDDSGAGAARPCDCRDRELLPALLAAAGLPPRYASCRLATFSVDHDRPYRTTLLRAKTLCQRYIDGFLTEEGKFRDSGLLLVGPPGTGKTHLAAAVLVELIRRFRLRGRFVDFNGLIHEIQSTFDPASPTSKHHVLEPVIEAELLVLDELGAQKPTAWVSDILYLILNSRYTRRLPTIFTTNYRLEVDGEGTLESMGPDSLASRIPATLISRLFEMAQLVEVHAADFRRKIKARNHHV